MSDTCNRIGFVDYELDNFHANVYLGALRNELGARDFEVTACHAMNQESGAQWAAENDLRYFEDPAEMNEHVDAYVVLAPSNPEVHLELCEKAFPFGKITYVDKTFAPDLATAEQIFALADQYHVPVQTTSALRYTPVQQYVREVGAEKVRHMVSWGGGGSFGEYAIHPVELVLSCMGPEVESMMRRGTDQYSQLLLNFSGDRTAVVNVYVKTKTPFAATVSTNDETRYLTVDNGVLFVNMARALLDFFEKGEPDIDRNESLMVRRVLDRAGDPGTLDGFVPIK